MALKCLECEKFDRETSEKMRELFSREEMLISASSIVSFLVTLTNQLKKIDRNDLKRFHFQAQIDVASRTIGKFVVSLEPKDRENFVKIIEQQSGVKLAINHETCPHGNEEESEVRRNPEGETRE